MLFIVLGLELGLGLNLEVDLVSWLVSRFVVIRKFRLEAVRGRSRQWAATIVRQERTIS